MIRVLEIGPSPTRSRGGMATVIQGIKDDKDLNKEFKIDIFESYIDGGKIKRLIYSIYAFLVFYFTKRNYDIYHIHLASKGSTFRKGYYARAAKRWGKKVILHIHGAKYIEFYNESDKKKKKKIENILKKADVVIALSDEWKKTFEALFGITNCVVLNNGIDVEKYEKAKADPAIYNNDFLVLGRLGERKGTYDLIDAVQIAININPNIKIYLAGDGEINKVKELIQEKGLNSNIKVVGWVDYQGEIKLFKKVSTVVLPSYNEGLPMSILEGMAAGKAIISTSVGAIPDVIKKENGRLIDPGDVPALAQALLDFSANIDMLRNMGEGNFEKADKYYGMHTMHERLANYYNVLIASTIKKT